MRIMVMDGQGGGVGRSLLEALKERFPEAELIAVGTNATATANMMKSGVTSGATGENAVVYNSKRADVIVGPVGIVMADAMLGEITPTMAAAVASNDAKLILIPILYVALERAHLLPVRYPAVSVSAETEAA